MLLAALFSVALLGLVWFLLVKVGRHGRNGTSFTGPKDRDIDYDNPYGQGTYFWTNKRQS